MNEARPGGGYSSAVRPPAARGFTLIEVLVVVTLMSVLMAIAIPPFVDYVRRGRVTEAITRLADHHVRMEQYFFDNRRYDDGAGACGYPPAAPGPADTFALECVADAATYTVTARGLAGKGMADFAYSVDQSDAKRTLSVPTGWAVNDQCWVVRRDGWCV